MSEETTLEIKRDGVRQILPGQATISNQVNLVDGSGHSSSGALTDYAVAGPQVPCEA